MREQIQMTKVRSVSARVIQIQDLAESTLPPVPHINPSTASRVLYLPLTPIMQLVVHRSICGIREGSMRLCLSPEILYLNNGIQTTTLRVLYLLPTPIIRLMVRRSI